MCCETVLRRPSTPIDPGAEVQAQHLALDPAPASVGVARSFVRDALADLDEDERETALLLASELVTNAILHARTPVQLAVARNDDRALVCVADRLSGGAAVTPRSHTPDRPGGRGLALVEELSDSWGTESYSGGKTVWFALAVASRAVPAR